MPIVLNGWNLTLIGTFKVQVRFLSDRLNVLQFGAVTCQKLFLAFFSLSSWALATPNTQCSSKTISNYRQVYAVVSTAFFLVDTFYRGPHLLCMLLHLNKIFRLYLCVYDICAFIDLYVFCRYEKKIHHWPMGICPYKNDAHEQSFKSKSFSLVL